MLQDAIGQFSLSGQAEQGPLRAVSAMWSSATSGTPCAQ